MNYPEKLVNEEQLEELLSRPSGKVIELFKKLEGDVIFLGIAGKIGPSIARMAKRASEDAGVPRRVIGVSRFRNEQEQKDIGRFALKLSVEICLILILLKACLRLKM